VFLVLASALAWGQRVEDCFSRDPGPLDFIRGEGPEQAILQALTGDALVGIDANGNVVPRLASTWTPGPKGSLCFQLRRDVRFQDGRAVDLEDVRWTFRTLQSDPSASPTKRAILEGVQIRAEGDRLVLASSKPPARLLLELARIPVAERGHPDQGSGPFRLRREPGAWSLERREHFLGPRIAGLRFRFLGDSQAEYLALQKGWLTLGQPPSRLQEHPPAAYRVLVQPKPFQLVVWSRAGTAPLQALERWRRDAFPPHLLGAGARPSRGLLPEALGFAPRTILAPPAVLPPGKPLTLLYAAEDGPVEKLLMALRERARGDGIQMDLVPVPQSLLVARLQAGTFELACFIAAFEPEPWSVLEYMEPSGPMNFTGWRSPSLGPLVARLRTPRDGAWRELQDLWARAPGALPLVDFQSTLWVDRRLRLTSGPLGLYLTTPGPAGWSWQP
jgi:ABC-type transport system substrate-binding protein